MKNDNHCLHFDKTITSWDEGIPLGNGDIGCLIWGKADALRFSVDKNDLWDCSSHPEAGGEYTFANLKRLYEEKNSAEIGRIFDEPYNRPVPTKLPAGKIIINLNTSAEVSSTLTLENAEAEITAGSVRLQSFVCADSPVGFIKINTESACVSIENPAYGKLSENGEATADDSKASITQSLENLHYEDAEKTEYTENGVTYKYFTQKIADEKCYGLFSASEQKGGETLVVYTVYIGKSADEITAESEALLKAALENGYEKSFEKHLEYWRSFWSKSFVKLNDETLENNWYMGNYLLGSCSRKGKFPMPLQGVWTADNGELPPWKGDYHHDLNTELCYSSYLKANRIDEGSCFVDYLISQQKQGKGFAKNFFGADGLCLPGVTDIDGNPLGGWAMYSLSPSNTGWLCKEIYDYCIYTDDLRFIKENAYPFISAYGDFLLSFMSENEDGKLVFSLSSSPEIHDNTMKAFLTPNSTYDLALVKNTFENLCALSRLADSEKDTEKWKAALDKLDDFPLEKDGGLMISRDEAFTESHRHFSHLMPIYPLKMLSYDDDNEWKVIDASIKKLEKLGTDYYCGYSFAWLSQLYVIQKNNEKAAETLKTFWNYFCLPNGFHCNGDYLDKGYSNFKYRPFTLEGNFLAVSALQEMLLFDENGKTELCRAVPDNMQNFAFKLRSENGALITAEIENGAPEKIQIEALRDCDFLLLYKGKSIERIRLKKGMKKLVTVTTR